MYRTVLTAIGLLAMIQPGWTQGFPGELPEGRFNLPADSTAGAILATVPGPAYYRVCIDGELGSRLRIQIGDGSGSPSFLLANSCTDLLVTGQLKVNFAPDSLTANVVGRYDLLGFRRLPSVGGPAR